MIYTSYTNNILAYRETDTRFNVGYFIHWKPNCL